jgi:hypothetical protein
MGYGISGAGRLQEQRSWAVVLCQSPATMLAWPSGLVGDMVKQRQKTPNQCAGLLG